MQSLINQKKEKEREERREKNLKNAEKKRREKNKKKRENQKREENLNTKKLWLKEIVTDSGRSSIERKSSIIIIKEINYF